MWTDYFVSQQMRTAFFGVSFVETLFYFGRGVIFYNKVLFFTTELKLDYEWSNMNLSIVRR